MVTNIVRRIYSLFMEGKSYSSIAKALTTNGIPSPMGKPVWGLATVRNILSNETYKGSKKMQKTYVTNYLTKSKKANDGELPSYFIAESHQPIIPPDEWDAVQAEVARRKGLGRPVSCQSVFATKIKCGSCGARFGSKVWQSNTQYRQVIWRCNDRYNKQGQRDCQTSHIKEDDIKAKFITAFNRLMENRDGLLEDCREALELLCDTASLDAEIAEQERELETVEGLARQAIQQNAREAVNQSEWAERSGLYLQRHSEATRRLAELNRQRTDRLGRAKTLTLFIAKLERSGQAITAFDESLWVAVVDYVTVGADGGLAFRFRNGAEVGVV